MAGSYMCSRAKACVAVWLDDTRIGVLGQNEPGEALTFDFVTQNDAGQWVQGDWAKPAPGKKPGVDLARAQVAVETGPQRRGVGNRVRQDRRRGGEGVGVSGYERVVEES